MNKDAGALGCPRCGAPASPDATACPFCRTPLALISCPSCFTKLFQGYRHCPQCGAAAAREEAVAGGPKPCANCSDPLVIATIGSVRLGECPACGGVWVDAKSFESLCKDREKQASVLGAARRMAMAGDRGTGKPYRPCPECRELMHRVNFAKCSGVIVDVCKPHGVFFDVDELRCVVAFLSSGGLDRSRELEKEDLRAEREKLRWEQALAQKGRFDPQYSASAGDTMDLADVLSVAGGLVDFFGGND
jgi:Zn-finger nucleic acid-binding protein